MHTGQPRFYRLIWHDHQPDITMYLGSHWSRRRLNVLAFNWVGFFLLSLLATEAAVLTRGPYLQTGTQDSIRIRWRTAEPEASVVFYGLDQGLLYEIAGGLLPKVDHEVVLRGLDPDTRYFYSVGTLSETLAEGADYYFRTSPVPGTPKKTRIWAIGDCGTAGLALTERQREVRDAYIAHSGGGPTDVWLALGDNAYFAGLDSEYQRRFFDIYPTLLRNTVLWSTLGNHELYGGPADGVYDYFKIFSLPTQGEAGGVPSGTESYYSFDHGNIHFVCLDSEDLPYRGATAMTRWLAEDLAANTNEWLIAFWHSPPYSKGSHDSDDEFSLTYMRTNVVPLLESYGVDLVLSGHSHIYERSFFLHGHYGVSSTLTADMKVDAGSGRSEDTGVYLKTTAGPSAGHGAVYIVAGSSGWATFRFGVHPAMYFDALETGSMVIDVEGNRLDAKFLRDTGEIRDQFAILKSNQPAPLQVRRLRLAEGQLLASFRSVAGSYYEVEFSPDLHEPIWQRVGDTLQASGSMTDWTHPHDPFSGHGFFRVIEVEPPPPAASRLP